MIKDIIDYEIKILNFIRELREDVEKEFEQENRDSYNIEGGENDRTKSFGINEAD